MYAYVSHLRAVNLIKFMKGISIILLASEHEFNVDSLICVSKVTEKLQQSKQKVVLYSCDKAERKCLEEVGQLAALIGVDKSYYETLIAAHENTNISLLVKNIIERGKTLEKTGGFIVVVSFRTERLRRLAAHLMIDPNESKASEELLARLNTDNDDIKKQYKKQKITTVTISKDAIGLGFYGTELDRQLDFIIESSKSCWIPLQTINQEHKAFKERLRQELLLIKQKKECKDSLAIQIKQLGFSPRQLKAYGKIAHYPY